MEENLIRFNKKIKLLFIDFETANLCLNYRFNLPWQMALINTVGGEPVDGGKDILINWGDDFKFSKGAEAMAYSYSQERMDKDGLKPIDALKILSENLNSCDGIVGHNILGFDIYLIKCMYNKLGRPYPDILSKKPIFDTFAMAKGYFNNIPYQKGNDFAFYQYKVLNQIIKGSKNSLSKVASNFNIAYDESKLHDALYDLGLNVQVWNKLKFQVDI
jgi:DNA polymerase III epsilon subunit-like protein